MIMLKRRVGLNALSGRFMSRKSRRRKCEEGAGMPVMVKSLMENLNVSSFLPKTGIPENHWTLLFLGEQGVGKSQLASLTVKKLSLLEGFPVVVVCDSMKESTVKQWWEKNVPEHVWWRGLTFAQLKRLRNCILVLEDAPLILRSKSRAIAVKSLLTAISRENRILTVVTSQYGLGRELKTAVPVRVEMQVAGGRYMFRVCEWRNASAWFDWTANSPANVESAEPVVEAVYHGVNGGNLGRAGRKVKCESKRQKAFMMFDRGCSNREVKETLGLSYELVKVYRYEWNERKRSGIQNTYLLTIDGGGGAEAVAMEKVWNEA